MKKLFQILSVALSISLFVLFGFMLIAYENTSDYYFVNDTENSLNLPAELGLKQSKNSALNKSVMSERKSNIEAVDIMLFDIFPVKKATIETLADTEVVPCATPFGIKLYTQGVLVVAMSDVKCDQNYINPAKDAGLITGDVITSINDKAVNTNEEVANIIENCNGEELSLNVKRGDENLTLTIQPVKSYTENTYKAGLWVRDSSAGIGTLTYYDPKTQNFAGLGHGVCDVDTGELLPLLSGDIVRASISDIIKGEKGSPGELRGSFSDDVSIGTLRANTQAGVYGVMSDFSVKGEAVSVALKQSIQKGPAQVLVSTDNNEPKLYDIEIESINYKADNLTKNMVIHITSEELLDKTGGIIQGMSGSPIIQNGNLIAAVTHVFVNDPTRGYAIFAESMLKTANEVL